MSVVFGFPVAHSVGDACHARTSKVDTDFLKSVKASRKIWAYEQTEKQKWPSDFRFRAARGAEYAYERFIGGGGEGEVYFFRLVNRAGGDVPEGIAVKTCAKGSKELSVLKKMNETDERTGASECDWIPAWVVPNVSDTMYVVVLRPADGDLSSLFDESEPMVESVLVKLLDGILQEMECIRKKYNMVMTDFKAKNLLYSCTDDGAIDLVFSDYGAFEMEDLTSKTKDVTTFPPIQSFVSLSNGAYPTQPDTLYMLFPLIVQLSSGKTKFDGFYAHVPENVRDRKQQFEKKQRRFRETFETNPMNASDAMMTFLEYLTGYTRSTRQLRIWSSHDLEPWFHYRDSTYASTYQDARRLLADIFQAPPRFRRIVSALAKRF